jgi:membrane-bound metal-dependent hydrolase YbcI (DUF457 family)
LSKLLLSPFRLSLAAVGLLLADWGYRLIGDSFIPGGPLDETAHALTTLIVMWALGRRACERFLIPALVASVAIDLDHVPAQLGFDFLTRGTPRPHTHSLLTIAVVLLGASIWRSRRDVFLGMAIGLALHFWRDMAESNAGVSLLWPFSSHAFSTSHTGYLAVVGALALLDAFRCRKARLAQARRTVPEGAGP